MKKERLYLFTGLTILLFLCIIPYVSAGLFDFLTGKATSDTTSLSITVGNTAPTITFVSAIPTQSVTELGTTTIPVTFLASDTDGAANLNNASASAQFNRTGETTRADLDCTAVGTVDATTVNYSCSIDMWYWDANGDWSINVTVRDINSALASDDVTVFTLDLTTAMQMNPTSLAWNSLSPTDTDELSTSNPITINNTANRDITDGNVEVTALNLQGETTTSEYLLAEDFSVNTANACEGTAMVHSTATGVSGATVTAGNLTAGNGQEDLYFCLEEVTGGISSQTYSTTGLGEWTVAVS